MIYKAFEGTILGYKLISKRIIHKQLVMYICECYCESKSGPVVQKAQLMEAARTDSSVLAFICCLLLIKSNDEADYI